MLQDKQVLVKVKYSAINRADLAQKAGKYPHPIGHSAILGIEAYGEVIDCGSNVIKFQTGDMIAALVNGGGYADTCVVEEDLAFKQPDFLSDVECASVPEVYMTALFNLLEIGQVKSGNTVLIHAAASGVGQAMIQVAKLLGVKSIATVRSVTKVLACQTAGADITLVQENGKPNFAEELQQRNINVDVVLDLVSGNYIDLDLHVLNPGGKLITIGLLGGSEVKANFALLLHKNIQIIGSTLRNKSNEVKSRLMDMVKEMILPALKLQKIKISVDKIFDIQDVELVHAYIANNENVGKVLLQH